MESEIESSTRFLTIMAIHSGIVRSGYPLCVPTKDVSIHLKITFEILIKIWFGPWITKRSLFIRMSFAKVDKWQLISIVRFCVSWRFLLLWLSVSVVLLFPLIVDVFPSDLDCYPKFSFLNEIWLLKSDKIQLYLFTAFQ